MTGYTSGDAPPQYLTTPGGDMAWLKSGDTGMGYPAGWVLANLTICFSAWHTAGVGHALTVRAKEFGANKVAFLHKNRGGDATNITGACFSDWAAEPMPADASAAPFTGPAAG